MTSDSSPDSSAVRWYSTSLRSGAVAAAVAAAILAAGTPAAAAETPPGRPRLVPLEHGTTDLVPVVSFDVTAAPYAADPTGERDCTAGFAAALADAGRRGGTVFAPAGRYRIDGVLKIPPGVTLRGDWKMPVKNDVSVGGTVLLATAGRGSADGTAFISVDQGGVRDLSIFYPEQQAGKVAPYPCAVHLVGSAALKNVMLVNAYRGVLTGSFSTVMNLCGTTLDSGLTMMKAVAVPRCRNIRLSPRFWSGSGLAGAPSYDRVRGILAERKACGIQLNRQDAGIFFNIEIDGYHTGLRFMPPHGWTYWHNIIIRNTAVGIHFTGGSDHRAYMTGCSIAADRCGVLMKMDTRGWDPRWKKHSKSGKPYGVERDTGHLRMYDCRIAGGGTGIRLDGSFRQKINLQECTFAAWGDGGGDAAIAAVGGDIAVCDCRFAKDGRHVRIEGKPASLALVGNRFAGEPDIRAPRAGDAEIDHTPAAGPRRGMRPIRPPPDRLPARTDALYVATAAPFNAPADGAGDAAAGIQAALDRAGGDGGGTVYLPQGRYRLTRHLTVPAGVELRGVNDFMPRGVQVRTLLVADIPADRGAPRNPPLIGLQSSPRRGGSGVAGLGIWYPRQDYRKIRAYPWTIRGFGPGCWVQRVYLGNCYNAVDFATRDSDRHVIARVCGSALNSAFFVGNCPTIGWIDNCHIRPQDWALSSQKAGGRRPGYVFEIPGDACSKPTRKDIFRGTRYSLIPNMRGAGAVTVGSGANEQVTAFFTNGATRAFDFVDHDGSGGGSATVLIGGSEAGWGARVRALGEKGLTMVNFSFNPMTRLPYVKPADIPDGQLPKGLAMRIDDTVSPATPITLIMPKFYGRKEIDVGIDMRGGDVFIKQGLASHYRRGMVAIRGGTFRSRNTPMGPVIRGAE